MPQTLSLKVGSSKVLSFQCGYSNGTYRNPLEGDCNFIIDNPFVTVEAIDKFNFKVTATKPGTVNFSTVYHFGGKDYTDSIILEIPEVVEQPTVTSIAMKEIV